MKIENKIYFFPAVLPLMAVIPWLLTAFGAIAGFLAGLLAGRKSRALILGIAAVSVFSLGAAGWLLWPKLGLRYLDHGSRLVDPSNLPVSTKLGEIEHEPVPPPPHRAAWESWVPLWAAKPAHRPLSDIVVTENSLIVGTWEGAVDAYSLASGKPLWSVQKKEPVIALTHSGDLLIAGEGVHTSEISALTAIRISDGTVLWSREFDGHLESPANINSGIIYFGAGPAGFYCLDASDGKVIWKKSGVHVDSTPLVTKEMVYFAGQEDEDRQESTLFALNRADGTEAWKINVPGQPWGSPVLDSDRQQILLTSGIGQIGLLRDSDRGWAHAVSINDRTVRWTRPLAGNPLETPIYLPVPGLLITTATIGEISALRADSGTTAWKMPLGAEIVAQPDIDLGQAPPRIASLDTNGKLRLQSGITGAFLDEHDFSPGANSGPRFLPDGVLIALPKMIARYRW